MKSHSEPRHLCCGRPIERARFDGARWVPAAHECNNAADVAGLDAAAMRDEAIAGVTEPKENEVAK